MLAQEVVLQVPDPQGGEVEAVRREAGAVLASVAPEATLRVDTAPGEGAVTIDGKRVSPLRTRYRREPQELARQLAWTLFWSLLERTPVLERPARVACHGITDGSALTRLESTLGVTVATAAGAPLPAGLEPGPRLAIGGLLSAVLDESDGDRRAADRRRACCGARRRISWERSTCRPSSRAWSATVRSWPRRCASGSPSRS